jgi:hypothetical protein
VPVAARLGGQQPDRAGRLEPGARLHQRVDQVTVVLAPPQEHDIDDVVTLVVSEGCAGAGPHRVEQLRVDVVVVADLLHQHALGDPEPVGSRALHVRVTGGAAHVVCLPLDRRRWPVGSPALRSQSRPGPCWQVTRRAVSDGGVRPTRVHPGSGGIVGRRYTPLREEPTVQIEHEYGVPPREIFAVLTDAEFLRARGERFGSPAPATVERAATGAIVSTPRQIPLEEVPSAFRRYVGDGSLRQTDTFNHVSDERVAGTWVTDAGSVPVTMRGTHEITASGTGSRYVVTAEVKVGVPLVGGMLSGEVSKFLGQLVRKEQEFLAEWLSAR